VTPDGLPLAASPDGEGAAGAAARHIRVRDRATRQDDQPRGTRPAPSSGQKVALALLVWKGGAHLKLVLGCARRLLEEQDYEAIIPAALLVAGATWLLEQGPTDMSPLLEPT